MDLVLTSVVGQQNYMNVWCIIIVIYYVFLFKMYFVNGDKSAGIFCVLVQINEWNSWHKGKHHTLWGACFVKSSCGCWKSAISFIIFWDFSVFYQIFLTPQVKRWASWVAERLNTEDLRKLENIRKLSKRHRMIAQCPVPPLQNESSTNTSRKLLKNRN